jgi:hypothetical protein
VWRGQLSKVVASFWLWKPEGTGDTSKQYGQEKIESAHSFMIENAVTAFMSS